MNKNLDRIHKSIIERDNKDAKIYDENRRSLTKVGLRLYKPKRIIKINTGEVIGVNNVANLIAEQLKENEKIISIEGTSGCGKSSTAEMLAKKIGANQFSAGEIFRYLTYYLKKNPKLNPDDILLNLSLEAFGDRVCLYLEGENISVKLKNSLHAHNIDLLVADVARICQAEVIKLMSREIKRLAKNPQQKIVLDGRAQSLDFLPSDLRVILYADACVRAKRRLEQNGG
jgi:cytidylate kinase